MMTENDRRLEALFNELVPRMGKAESLAGELVRAAGRIGYRWFNDGDSIGIGYGKETCNAAARFLIVHGNREIQVLITSLWGLNNHDAYGRILDHLVGAVVNYIEANPDLRSLPTEDMFDYYDEEIDVDEDFDDLS